MAKKILVMTGSARRGGNSEQMADAFIQGAETAGHEVIRYETAFQNIEGCLHCNTCFSKGNDTACTHDAIFNELALLYETSDAIVYITPMFWYTFPAKLKAAMDKMYAFLVGKRALGVKESMLLVVAAEEDEVQYEPMIRTYEQIARDCGWKDRGHYIAGGFNRRGAIKGTDHLKQIWELGRKM